MKLTHQFVAAFVVALALAACGADSGPAGDPALGEELYARSSILNRNCFLAQNAIPSMVVLHADRHLKALESVQGSASPA